MDDKTWERYGALGGIWFVVFAVVGSFLAGAPPSRDDAAEIAEWFVDNDGAIQTGAFLSGIGVIGLVWWFGTLWRAMRPPSGMAYEGRPLTPHATAPRRGRRLPIRLGCLR